jgi:hypothetical protein
VDVPLPRHLPRSRGWGPPGPHPVSELDLSTIRSPLKSLCRKPLSATFVGLCNYPQRAARVRSRAAIRSLPGSMVSSTKSPTNRDRKSPEGEEAARPKLPVVAQWVIKSHPERLTTPGSESCVVVREGGTKRRQRVLKPCDRASKYTNVGVFALLSAGTASARRSGEARSVRPGSKSRAKVHRGSLETCETRPRPWGPHRNGWNRSSTSRPSRRDSQAERSEEGESTQGNPTQRCKRSVGRAGRES